MAVDRGAPRRAWCRKEFGHNLFLGQGNGLDDNGDGRLAGMTGPRRCDEYCEPGWLPAPNNIEVAEDVSSLTPCSLMTRYACSSIIRPLQVDTAHGVARYIPGFVDGTPVPVVGYVLPLMGLLTRE